MTAERGQFAIDENAMKEVNDYRKAWKAFQNKIKETLAQLPPKTVDHDRYERSCAILRKLLELEFP